MNQVKAMKIIKLWKRPKIAENVYIARQDKNDIYDIENTDTDELIKEWKALVHMNYIYETISLNDLERIALIELEFQERDVDMDPLANWFNEAERQFNEENDYE